MPYKNKEDKLACQRRWYRRNKEKRRKQIDKRARGIKIWFEEYRKTVKCIKCGENHPACLDFHHKENNKKREISAMVEDGFSIKNIKKEISKCVPLCSNCHRKEHYKKR